MYRIWLTLLCIECFGMPPASAQNTFYFVKDNKSPFSVAVDTKDPVSMTAANSLVICVQLGTGVKLPITPLVGTTMSPNTIQLIRDTNAHDIPKDAFDIKTGNGNIQITGGYRKGLLYGVYYFMTNFCQMHMYSRDRIDFKPMQSVPLSVNLDIKQNPSFEYRSIFFRDATNQGYCDFNGLYSIYDPKANKSIFEDWGLFVHTLDTLVPKETYFSTHPEYFAEVNGQRTPTQIDPSNPDVVKIIVADLKRRMAQNPSAKYWSVSQNDNPDYCHCPICSSLIAKEGSPQAPILKMVNEIAKYFPDKVISTLAYNYSETPPRTIKPASNVLIMLCYGANRTAPITQDADAQQFRSDLEAWTKLTNKIMIWDYFAQFNNLLRPFPNMEILQSDIRYFKQKGISMILEQGWDKSSFSEVKGYLIAQLMWNVDVDLQAETKTFMDVYYGAASDEVLTYFNLLEQKRKESNTTLFLQPNDAADNIIFQSYLSEDNVRLYSSLLKEAAAKVDTSSDFYQRVKHLKLGLDYVTLQRWRMNSASMSVDKAEQLLQLFVDECIKYKINTLSEAGMTPKAYQQNYLAFIKQTGH